MEQLFNPQPSFATAEACSSYIWAANGQTYTSSGIYTDTLSAVNGCDSIVNLNLTVNNLESSSTTQTVCGNYIWSANNQSYSVSGLYTANLSTVNGCDSVVTLNLTVNNLESTSITEESCGNYIWPANNQSYATSGVYTANLSTVNGCDSVVTLNLTVNTIDTQVTIDADEITLLSTPGYTAYQWVKCDNDFEIIQGANTSSYTVSSNGSYSVIVNDGTCSDTSGCITIDKVNLSEEFKNIMKIYPNPTSGMVNIDFMESFDQSTIRVYDMTGKIVQEFEVKNQDQFQFILKGETGVYTIEIQTYSGVVQRNRLTKLN